MLASIVLAASALAATVSAQGVTSKISPTAAAPAGCTGTMAQPFNIAVVNATTASKMKRASSSADTLTITLNNGVLTDSQNRTGYIASNYQFQFDAPVQAGAIYTSGFSVCSNGTLALGGSAVWYECLSGDFYNLYDQSIGAQCSAIFIDAIAVASTSSSSVSAAASQTTDGQIQATSAASSLASSTSKVSQITDGQIQATTAASSLASSTSKTSSTAVVSQITDGQIQATTAASAKTSSTSSVAKVSQITDGQIQATTAATTVAAYTGGAAIQTAAPAAAALGLAALFML